MKHFYSEDSNGIVVTFSDIKSVNGIDTVPFYVEQEVQGHREPFYFAEGVLPFFQFNRSYGFSSNQLNDLLDYIKRNSVLIFELARDASTA